MAYELIETIEVGAGGASSIEFTSIPQDGVDLLLMFSYRDDLSSSVGYASMRLNNDTGSNYSLLSLNGNGSSASSGSDTNTSFKNVYAQAGNATANTFGNIAYYISNYTSSTDKSISIDVVSENNASLAQMGIYACSYSTSSAITQIKLFNAQNLTASAEFSTASLYKIY